MFYSNSFISRKIVFIWLILISTTVLSNELIQRDNDVDREKAAELVTQQFIKQLGGHLKKEMKANGPVAAIKVCKDVAPSIAQKLSLENGWKVTRVTSKPRNALLGTADSWEQKTLTEFETRAGKGESYAKMTKAEVVEESGKTYFRYMKPLAVKPVCLSCHGSDKQISDAVQVELDKTYPYDLARGYKAGDLRGAVSIMQPLDIPLRKTF